MTTTKCCLQHEQQTNLLYHYSETILLVQNEDTDLRQNEIITQSTELLHKGTQQNKSLNTPMEAQVREEV
jgi:hypothetical protein